MKIKLATVAAIAAMTMSSHGANFVISNVSDGLTDTLFADADNNLLPSGVVTLGVFQTGFDVAGNVTNLSQLVSNFTTIFASGAIGNNSTSLGGVYPGYAEHGVVDNAPLLTGNTLIGQILYLFAGDGVDLGSSNAFALLNMGPLQNEDGGELDFVANPAFRLGAPLIGVIDSKTGDFGGQGVSTFTTLQLVPEPSAALLGALGALGLLRRRRI
jgi:hypothetical protein